MRMFFKALCCSFIICCMMSMTGFCGACDDISNEVFRLHILANSDSNEDQQLKLKIRDGILQYTETIFACSESKEQSMALAEAHLDDIKNYAQSLIYRYGYRYHVDAYIAKMPFKTRTYEHFTLPAGNYDALRIVIGSGKGHNWWCVLYPSLCLPSAQSDDELNKAMNEQEKNIVSDTETYRVKFKIVEWWEELCSCFERNNQKNSH